MHLIEAIEECKTQSGVVIYTVKTPDCIDTFEMKVRLGIKEDERCPQGDYCRGPRKWRSIEGICEKALAIRNP
jgi:hypothetical protein